MDKRVAVVTGSSSGIGVAVARRLTSAGWDVAGLDLSASDEHQTYRCDVTDISSVGDALSLIRERHGEIDVAVTAAGSWAGTDPFEHDQVLWRKLMAVHVGGTVNVVKAVAPPMMEVGRGNIVMITTDLALNGNPDDAYYVTAKGAVLGMMRGLVAELEGAGVRVNTVAPGATDTPILPPDSIWRSEEKLSVLPLPRLVDPAEIAESVLFLCAGDCHLNGQIISPNAGQAR